MGKLFLLIIIQGGLLFCQLFPSVKSAGKAYSGSVNEVSEFSILVNPSLIAKGRNSVGISIIPQAFGLTELSQKSLGTIYNLPFLTLGFSYQNYGFELLKKQKFSFGAAKEIFKDLFFGCSALIDHTNIKNYGSTSNTVINTGFSFSPVKKLNFGIAVKNLLQFKKTASETSSGTTFLFGFNYLPAEALSVSFQLSKQQLIDISLSAGVELRFLEFMSLRAGFAKNPDIFSCGLSLKVEFFEVNYALQVHDYLDDTQLFGVSINY